MKKRICCLALAASIFLCSCASNPEKEIVTSKNDGSFDANVVQSATENSNPDETQAVSYNETFTSTDGSVKFTLSVDEDIPFSAVPVVKVAPHYLSGDDVQRVGQALFGNAVFYEQGPILGGIYTKDEIQRKLSFVTPYINIEKMSELYSTEVCGEESITMEVEDLKLFVDYLTAQYETAPVENPYGLCQWEFKNGAYYLYSEEDIAAGGMNLSSFNEEIYSRVQVNGVPYLLTASRRNQEDFKLNNIYVRIDSGSMPSTLELDAFTAQLCSFEPTQDQLMSVKQNAEQMLSSMNLGDWYVDECFVEVNPNERLAPETYIIHINAVPVINGVPAIRRPQFSNITSSEVYASNYYLTDANFQFSANGDIISFQMYSTIDVEDIVNDNVATLNMDEMMEIAKTHLTLSDRSNYGNTEEQLASWDSYYGETVICEIDICELEYGMTRVKVPNTDNNYYYIPALILSGTISYCGEQSGTVYQSNPDGIYPLVAINAVDGSIIQLDNE